MLYKYFNLLSTIRQKYSIRKRYSLLNYFIRDFLLTNIIFIRLLYLWNMRPFGSRWIQCENLWVPYLAHPFLWKCADCVHSCGWNSLWFIFCLSQLFTIVFLAFLLICNRAKIILTIAIRHPFLYGRILNSQHYFV